MKKITNFVLVGIGLIGSYMVGEGLITGEQLSDIQSVIGMSLGGGALSIGLIIAIIRALPIQLVNAGYAKLVDKYGQAKVDNLLANFDDMRNVLADTQTAVQEVKVLLEEAKEARESLLSE